jgi:predicted SnoaL-like aldol condensation-catalyzing enzyme
MKTTFNLMSISLAVALTTAITPSAQAQTAATKPTVAHSAEQARQNKALVLKAYQELFGDHDLGALDRYWAATYIQHNPYITDGTDSVKQYVQKLGLLNAPKSKVEFLRVAAEGDLVFLQTRQPAMRGNPEMVIVDIFRVEKGKIAEHWDVMQAVPADAVNKRPMY